MRRIFFVLFVLVSACRSGAPPVAMEAPGIPLSDTRVPALPPDSIPTAIAREIYADSNYVAVPGVSGTFPRNVVWVTFHDTVPQEERREAIDLIAGAVIGGIPFGLGGLYVVRIPHDGTGQPVADAIATLKALPQVRFASPDLNRELVPNKPD